MNRFSKASLLAGTVMAGAMFAAPAHAQDTDTGEEAAPTENRIVVTGSRISRRNVETAAPVAVVDAEEFQLSGTVNVENVINTLPQVVPGTTSFSNNPGNGTASLNLRGLGATRTLVLVNGRRWMFYDTGQIVDLNTIPSFLLEGVDVVTGGASAVYGSDALAGVVNFRLKQLEGVEFGGQYSLTQQGDGARYQMYGAIGASFDDGRGNATVYGEYYNREAIFQADRDFSFFALSDRTFGPQLRQGGSSLIEQGRLQYRGNGNRTGTAFAANGLAVFNTPGELTAFGGETYNYAPANYLQIPQERYLLGGYADYEFTDGHKFFTEIAFVNNSVAQELAPTPIAVNTNLDIDYLADAGFFSANTIAQLRALDASETGASQNDGLVAVQARRRLTEAGSRNSLDERSAFRVLTGVKGPITDTIDYEVYYSYARTRNSNIQQGNASISRFTAGLNGTGDTPINIFGLQTLTPEMVDAFRIQAQNSDISSLQVLTAVATGTFGDFAIGDSAPVGFAVGVERREVSSRFIPDEFLASGDVAGFNAGEPTEGGYDVREIFGELNIPIEFGESRLEFTGAARYSDYSLDLVGGAFTYAGGVEFQPIEDVILRGQYQRAIRAPNVGELFQGSAIGFPGATDPCGTAAATSGNLRAQCIANGVPAANLGNSTIIQPDSQTAAFFGGNPLLSEETSDSFTFGVVLQPSFIPGLTITADYFDISIDDAITTIGLQTALDLCFDGSASDLSSVNCAPFIGTRDATGAFDRNNGPQLGGANIANLAVSGIDLEVGYGTTLPFSLLTDTGEQKLNLNFLGTWTQKSAFSADQTDPTSEIRCEGLFGATCGEPTPTFKWTARASFIDGPLTTSIRWRHLSSVVDDDDGYDYAAVGGIERIDAYDLMDLTFSFDVNENFTFTAGVNNLFNTLPGTPTFDANGNVTNRPNSLLLGDNQEQANTYPSTFDVLGRDFFVSAAFKF